jgi:hypothetical protein
MTENELGKKLRDMYDNASPNEQTTMIHLFGIKYAEEIRDSGITPREILKKADMQESYQTEINKGIRLSKYVKIK